MRWLLKWVEIKNPVLILAYTVGYGTQSFWKANKKDKKNEAINLRVFTAVPAFQPFQELRDSKTPMTFCQTN